jgi:hypothetical protein
LEDFLKAAAEFSPAFKAGFLLEDFLKAAAMFRILIGGST